MIVGFDEVGRGSLAGPVMVGAAAIRTCDLSGPSPLAVPDGVADSKMLTEHRREAISEELKSWCASWAVGSASNTEIDDWGISYALGIAALRALGQAEEKLGIDGDGMLDGKPVKVGAILDGPNDHITKALNTFDAPDVPVPAEVSTKVKGDRYCATVATAAVIAKVTRDHIMIDLAKRPQYAPYEWDQQRLRFRGPSRRHSRTRAKRPTSPILASRLNPGLSLILPNDTRGRPSMGFIPPPDGRAVTILVAYGVWNTYFRRPIWSWITRPSKTIQSTRWRLTT